MSNVDKQQYTKFSVSFATKLAELETRAKASGTTFTEVCRRAGMSRATPDRWKNVLPLTVELIDRMETVIVEQEDKTTQAQQQEGTPAA